MNILLIANFFVLSVNVLYMWTFCLQKEKKLECVEEELERSQVDLQLALKRIADLHAVIEDCMEGDEIDSDLNRYANFLNSYCFNYIE